MTFIKITDINKNSFFKIEKKLFNNSCYQKEIKKEKNIVVKGETKIVEVTVIKEKLSDTSKILYSILCDLLPQSAENGWYDKNQNIYIRFSVEKLSKLLNKSVDTIVSCKKELETNELIKIVKKGYGKADVIFLCAIKKSLSKKDNVNIECWKNDVDMDKDIENLIAEENSILTFAENKKETSNISLEKTTAELLKNSEMKKEIVESKPIESFESIKTIFIKKRKTTKKEKNISSSYDFLKQEKYPLLKNITITNVNKFIPDISEKQVDKIYSLTEKAFSAGKIKDFNAVFYKGLKKEWEFAEIENISDEPDEEEIIKNNFERYIIMFKACDNFSFALECFVNSITDYNNELQKIYIQKFQDLEKETPAAPPSENQYFSFLSIAGQ